MSATGTIQPANQANLKFAQTGKVTAVGVKVGDTVTAGQTLASIDATSLQAAVTLAQQQLTAAQAQLTAATAAANSGQIASANAQVTSAQSKLTAAQDALGQASLTSSIAGTVAAVNVAVGDSVTGGSEHVRVDGVDGVDGRLDGVHGRGRWVRGDRVRRVGQHLRVVGVLGAGRRHRRRTRGWSTRRWAPPTSPS